MRQVRTGTILRSFAHTFLSTMAVLGLFTACASTPDHPDWIHVGVTTKDEVIARYGQPDWTIASPGGDTAVYRPTASGAAAPRIEIPIAQAGPFGSATTRMQPIDPGLGAKDLNGKTKERLRSEIRLRYDDRGVVRELSSP